MSFKKSDTSAKIKSFVSEDEAQDINAKRQEEWERVRKPGDPLSKYRLVIALRFSFEPQGLSISKLNWQSKYY